MARVKICGNTDVGQVRMASEAGADCAGFVVEYPVDVPWNLSRDDARGLLAAVPPFMTAAVVTGGSAEHVLAVARALRPGIVQLHTDNPPDETAQIADCLAGDGMRLIRALRIDAATGLASGDLPDPVGAALVLQECGIAALLLDARTGSLPAGTGLALSREMARAVRDALRIPLILAGGLGPGNVAAAVEAVRPFAVDVISGVESSRRVKDASLVSAFVRAAKGLPGPGQAPA